MRLLSVGVLCCSAILLAQSDRGTITGKVLDFDGSVASGAPVEAKSVETGEVFKTTSSTAGVYTFAGLLVGKYEVSIGVVGFKKRDATLAAGQTLNVDFRFGEADLGISIGTAGENDLATLLARANSKAPEPPSGPTPRLPNGKPDLSGFWIGRAALDLGHPEMLPGAEALFKERTDNFLKDAPNARCLPEGLIPGGRRYKFVQNPNVLVVIREEETPGYYQVFLDGRQHPRDLDPTWYGHSIGKWEGDTLVVDRIGFTDHRWLTPRGQPLSEKLHIIDRYRRPDLGHLEVETTIDDPGAYRKPWTLKWIAELSPDEDVVEYICNENNRDIERLIGK
jgi:hypothetical protein